MTNTVYTPFFDECPETFGFEGPFNLEKEKVRTYTYPDGRKFTIEQPMALYIKSDNKHSHRVVDKQGRCHRPEEGYVGITWECDDFEDRFQF